MEKLKTILVVLGLIFIGFVSGFYVHRQVSMHFIKDVIEMRSPKGFQDHFFSRIDATEEQKEQLLPIVETYSAKISQQHRELRRLRHELIDSMHAEVRPLLTEEQIQRMDEFSRRFRDRNRERRKREKMRLREKKEN